MARMTPLLRGNTLICQQNGQAHLLIVGTPDWYDWLTTVSTFAFVSEEGCFTARKERASNKRGGWYWKAYRTYGGRLVSTYLGKSEALTLERLNTIAAALTRKSANHDISDECTSFASCVDGVATRGERHSMSPEQALAVQDSTIMVMQAPGKLEVSNTVAQSSCSSAGLTRREIDVLRLLTTGLTSAQIAEQLIISVPTVNTHVRSIYRKLGVTSRSAATRYAIEHHLV